MKRYRTACISLTAALTLAACGDETTPSGPTVDWVDLASPHFIVRANPANTAAAEMEAVRDAAEAHFRGISAIVGAERTPARIIVILLDATRNGSRLQADGTILLGHGSDTRGRYLDALAHEITHAFRHEFFDQFRTWEWASFGFYEEGFASFVATEVDPGADGFPFFGFPEEVVVGQWVVSGEGVPPGVLRPRNQELNSQCEFQVYPMRASWYRYVDETYGRATVLAMAYSEVEVTTEVAQSLLGVSLEDLDAAWEQWVSDRYAAMPDAAALAQAYRERIAGVYVCVAGVDY